MSIKKPTGTNDFLPKSEQVWLNFQSRARHVFGLYGYKSIETPIIEQTELFVRGIGEATDVVSKEMFAALSGENLKTIASGGTVKNKSKLTLRPEGTAGVVRAVLENGMVQQGAAPVKLMYAGPMFRAERPQQGRYRQFHQVGIECLGANSPTIDAEAIIMLMQFYAEIGINLSDVVLLINSMGCENCRPAYRDAVAKFIFEHAESMCDTCKTRAEINPLRAFDCKRDDCAHVMQEAPRITDYLCDSCSQHHASVLKFLDDAKLSYKQDFSLVRGLDYYTRTVFEVQANTGGAQNAIGGGGRYDKLASEIGGADVPGLGFAIGYERCKLVLEAQGQTFADASGPCLFVVCAKDANSSDVEGKEREKGQAEDQEKQQAGTSRQSPQIAAFNLVQECRGAGLQADTDHQNRSVKSQFKLADKLGAKYVVTIGSAEINSGRVVCRNMETHEECEVGLDGVVDFLLDVSRT